MSSEKGEFEMDTCKRADYNNRADFVSKRGGYKGAE